MALTPRGIPYPDDYTAAADVPAALSSLAESVDDAIDQVDAKAVTASSDAQTAQTTATTAVNAVASHTHSGSGSVAIPLTSVTGLTATLAEKAETGHDHDFVYAAIGHQHDAQEIGAHTHAEYAATSHSHTQAQSHNTADTDNSPSAIHHTLGTGAFNAAAGNHTHSGYATDDHSHTDYSPTNHTHTAYSTTGHSHSASDVTGGTLSINRIPTGTSSTTAALGNHTHTTLGELNLTGAFRSAEYNNGDGLRVSSNGLVYSKSILETTSNDAPNVRVKGDGQLIRGTSSITNKTNVIPLHGLSSELTEVPSSKISDSGPNVDVFDVLTITPVEFQSTSEADNNAHLIGFIAEDVAHKFPFGADYNGYDVPQNVNDRAILAALLAVVQDQQRRINELEERLA